MASISCDKAGRRTVQFIGADGKRRTIRLGKVSKKAAETVRGHVEQLNNAKIIPGVGRARRDGRDGSETLTPVLSAKLAKVGLVQRRKAATLQAFITEYITSRVDVKPATKEIWSAGRAGPCGLLRRRQAGPGNHGGRRGQLQDAPDRPEARLDDDPQAAAICQDGLPGDGQASADRQQPVCRSRHSGDAWTPTVSNSSARRTRPSCWRPPRIRTWRTIIALAVTAACGARAKCFRCGGRILTGRRAGCE